MPAIYLDNAASTPLLPEVWEAMRPWALREGNAASSHSFGRAARQALDDARRRIASCLDADPDEILFTSGATEANNLAIFGLAGDAPGEILASPIEHPCVSEPIQKLVGRGFTLMPLPVQRNGVVDLASGGRQPPEGERPGQDDGSSRGTPSLGGLTPPARPFRLATLMLVNHETGAIQPVEALRQNLPAKSPFHCDAAAAAGKIPISFRNLGVSTLTISGHKFHGPPGIGALLVKKGTRLISLFAGGHQQHGKRPGTEPVALIVGLATALEAACVDLDRNRTYVAQLKARFLQLLADAGPIVVNSPPDAIPHIVNVSFPGLQGDALLMALDLAGVACSTGSACSSGSLLPSPVLRAMGAPTEVLQSAMRFSLSPSTSAADVDEAARRIVNSVNRLRQISRTGV